LLKTLQLYAYIIDIIFKMRKIALFFDMTMRHISLVL